MGDGRSQVRSSSSFHFAAGLSSGLLSAVLLQPADLLKTRVQQAHNTSLLGTIRLIASGPSPIRQFWRGTLPSALRTGFGSALYFSTLNSLRQHIARSRLLGVPQPTAGLSHHGSATHSSALPKISHTANLITGALARTMAGFVMMPVTVIKVRYESSMYSYTSLFGASRAIFRSEGLRGFFAGFGATAVRDAPYAGLYVLFYEWSKRSMSRIASKVSHSDGSSPNAKDSSNISAALDPQTSAIVNSSSATLAACLGTAITNPFDAIKTRLQLMPSKYGNMAHAAKLMLREEGIPALFNGLGLRITRKAISSALAWTVYEELIRRAEVRWMSPVGREEGKVGS